MASALVAAAFVVVCLVHATSAGTTFTHNKNTDWLAVWAYVSVLTPPSGRIPQTGRTDASPRQEMLFPLRAPSRTSESSAARPATPPATMARALLFARLLAPTPSLSTLVFFVCLRMALSASWMAPTSASPTSTPQATLFSRTEPNQTWISAAP